MFILIIIQIKDDIVLFLIRKVVVNMNSLILKMKIILNNKSSLETRSVFNGLKLRLNIFTKT